MTLDCGGMTPLSSSTKAASCRRTPKSTSVLVAVCAFLFAGAGLAGEWSSPVEVTFNQKTCLSYRAKLSGSYLAVEAAIAPGWHTFAMDNARRAAEKLEGKKALSQDMPTQITVSGGLAADGPWFQSPPKDFSRPALRWFSWGFEDRALFMVKARRSGDGLALLAISGQVCTETTCKKVDLSISIPADALIQNANEAHPDVTSLVQVR